MSLSRIEWGRPVVIVVTSLVQLPTVKLPSFVLTLQEIDNQGRLISTLGSLRDDGTGADAKASDGIFTLSLTMKPAALGDIRLRVSAGIAGNSLPVYSTVSTLTVVPASVPVARVTGASVIFETAPGVVTQEISLVNETVESDTGTTFTQERAIVSDDQSRAGIFSWITQVGLGDDQEGGTTAAFSYYDSKGLAWDANSPANYVFQPQQPHTPRLISSDGTRVALFAAKGAGSEPIIGVYAADGSSVYQLPDDTFADLLDGQISPNGRYLLILGILTKNLGAEYAIQVVDLQISQVSQLNFDLIQTGPPAIKISADGRFVVTLQGIDTILP